MHRRLCCIVISTCCAGAIAAAQPHDPTTMPATTAAGSAPSTSGAPAAGDPRVIEILTPIREKYSLPAIGAALLEGRDVAAIAVVGVRRAGKSEPVTLDDRWHLGSCTKAMTATLCAIFVQEGMLRWDTTLGEVFSNETMHEDWRAVTLEQLLAHRGGVPSDLSKDGLWATLWKREGTPTEQRMTLVRSLLRDPPLSRPGEAYLYSNAGFAIAGAMLERITGREWESLIRERLFQPLGMSTAGFGAPGDASTVDQPWGHERALLGLKPIAPGPQADNPPAIGPGGTVHCSLRDWARFVSLQLPRALDDKSLITPQTLRRLHQRPEAGNYAMGWVHADRSWGGHVAMHNGSNTLWFAVVWIAPERNFALLACTNVGGDRAEKALDDAVSGLLRLREKARRER